MNCLDAEARGWITIRDLFKFMKNYDIDISEQQICGMLGVYDKNMDGKIEFK